jgi:hypothetical protein
VDRLVLPLIKLLEGFETKDSLGTDSSAQQQLSRSLQTIKAVPERREVSATNDLHGWLIHQSTATALGLH